MPIITGPAGYDPILGEMRTVKVNGGTAADYTFNSAEFTVGIAGLVSLNQVPGSKLDTTMDIVNVTGTSVTLQPNTAYKMYATTGALNVTANPPAANKWAYEGHAEIFVGSVGYVVFDTSKIVLANQLEPDAVNNCTVRFHDGLAIISVEDHVAGYIVTVNASSGAGSLNYGLSTATNEYISVDASLNGQTLDLGGATTNGEKHVVGNGYTETIVSGGINCTSKTTFSNLSMDGVVVSSGTLTLGDVYIPNGSTVAVSGSGLAIEKVTGEGEGSVIKLTEQINATSSYANNCVFSGNTSRAFYVNSGCTLTASSCGFNGFTQDYYGACTYIRGGAATFIDCYDSGLVGSSFACLDLGASATLSGCTVDKNIVTSRATADLYFKGSNTFKGRFVPLIDNVGTVTLTSGATLDLTGNTNATPIAPGGGIRFEEGGATVYPSAGQASAYMLGGMTVPTIGNTNVVNLGGSNVVISSGATASASGCTFTGGSASFAAAIANNGSLLLSGVTVSGNSASANYGGGLVTYSGGSATIVSCTITGNSVLGGSGQGGGVVALDGAKTAINSSVVSGNNALSDIYIGSAAELELVGGNTVGNVVYTATQGNVTFTGNNAVAKVAPRADGVSGTVTISSGASINLTSSIAPGGTGGITVLTGGCTVNGNAIPAGTYTSIDSTGTPT